MLRLFIVCFCSLLGSAQGSVFELTDANFYEYAKDKDYLLVDFYAPWCKDSKALAPELDRAALALRGRSLDVVKVDCFGEGKGLCDNYKITHWPTLKNFYHGRLGEEYDGPHTAGAISTYVNTNADKYIVAPQTAPANPYVTTQTVDNTQTVLPKPPPVHVVSNQVAHSTGGVNYAANTVSQPAVNVAATHTVSSDSARLVPAVGYATNTVSQPVAHVVTHTAAHEPAVNVAGTVSHGAIVSKLPVTAGTYIGPVNSMVSVPYKKPFKIFQPDRQTVNALECAKCRVMTPEQAKENHCSSAMKRQCISFLQKQPAASVPAPAAVPAVSPAQVISPPMIAPAQTVANTNPAQMVQSFVNMNSGMKMNMLPSKKTLGKAHKGSKRGRRGRRYLLYPYAYYY